MVLVSSLVLQSCTSAEMTNSSLMVNAIGSALARLASSTSYASVCAPWTCSNADTRFVSRVTNSARSMLRTRQSTWTSSWRNISARILMAAVSSTSHTSLCSPSQSATEEVCMSLNIGLHINQSKKQSIKAKCTYFCIVSTDRESVQDKLSFAISPLFSFLFFAT